MPGVTDASVRTQLTAQFAVARPWSDKAAEVFATAPDDPMRFAHFDLDAGQLAPATGTAS
jgi:hypothetical protein